MTHNELRAVPSLATRWAPDLPSDLTLADYLRRAASTLDALPDARVVPARHVNTVVRLYEDLVGVHRLLPEIECWVVQPRPRDGDWPDDRKPWSGHRTREAANTWLTYWANWCDEELGTGRHGFHVARGVVAVDDYYGIHHAPDSKRGGRP